MSATLPLVATVLSTRVILKDAGRQIVAVVTTAVDSAYRHVAAKQMTAARGVVLRVTLTGIACGVLIVAAHSVAAPLSPVGVDAGAAAQVMGIVIGVFTGARPNAVARQSHAALVIVDPYAVEMGTASGVTTGWRVLIAVGWATATVFFLIVGVQHIAGTAVRSNVVRNYQSVNVRLAQPHVVYVMIIALGASQIVQAQCITAIVAVWAATPVLSIVCEEQDQNMDSPVMGKGVVLHVRG